MKKILRLGFLTLLITAAISSCKTFSYEELGSRNVEPTHQITNVPVVADIDLISTDKITYSEKFYDAGITAPSRFQLFRRNNNPAGANSIIVDACKYTAMAHAIKQYNADFLIAAIFDVKYTAKTDCLEITVTGYPAAYKNLREATPEDSWFINNK